MQSDRPLRLEPNESPFLHVTLRADPVCHLTGEHRSAPVNFSALTYAVEADQGRQPNHEPFQCPHRGYTSRYYRDPDTRIAGIMIGYFGTW
jgi:hypothetical protein